MALPASAQYQWRDENGRMQFSDRPPPMDVPEANIVKRARNAPITSLPKANHNPAAAPASLADKELEFRKRQNEGNEKAKKQEEEDKRQAQNKAACEQQRNNLAALEAGQRMSKFSSTGERIILDDKDREQEISRIRSDIQQYCK